MTEAPQPIEDTPQVTELAAPRRKAALGFIFATALMDVISLGIMIPVLPNLVKSMAGGDTSTAALWTTAFATVWGLSTFFFSPVLGLLSDRFGRRSVILISIFGLGIDYIFMALAPTLWWLFLGRFIHGATAASFATAGAYIADITPPKDRARRFGFIGAAWGVGFVVGPALGGMLGEINLRLPFYVAASLALINWLYGLLVLPESLPPERRIKTLDWRRASPLGSFRLLRRHHELLGLAGVTFCFQLAHNVLPTVFVLYTGERFGWSPLDVGIMMGCSGVANIIVQAIFVGRAVAAFGERRTLLFGLAAGATGMAVYGFAPNAVVFCLGVPVMALSGLIMPSLQGLMTRRVEQTEQGQLQGANSGITGVTAMIGPAIFGPLLAWATHEGSPVPFPGLPISTASAIMLCGFALAVRAGKRAVEKGGTQS